MDVGSVHIRLLPRPGFDLANLVVYDDPAFGAEPMLRASEVTADLRLTSLVRGRLEIARLNLTEPSLNLVQDERGRWNLEALLERTARTPLAPTAKTKAEPRPGFPYIEGTSARINFKRGPEKKPYALTNADFSLWQDSENAWGVRLRAQPVRTDLNLNDTGLLQVNGTWQRAANLHETPLQFKVEWSRAQLGQVTKIFTGSDKGWRGAIQFDMTVTGSPAKLQVSSTASVDDFRRYDIPSGKALRLAANCDAEYSSLTHEFQEVKCSAPVANGLISLTGNLRLPVNQGYAVVVTAEDVPASALLALAERAKKNLPDDLEAEGFLRGRLSIARNAGVESKFRFEGRGEILDFGLTSAANEAEIGRQTVPFLMSSETSARSRPQNWAWRNGSGTGIHERPLVQFGPIALEPGRPNGLNARGWIDRGGYDIAIAGEAEIAKTLRLARIIGVPAPPVNPEGSAGIDLQIAGSWAGQGSVAAGFVGPQVAGTANLRNTRFTFHGTGPVEIMSAEMQLLPDSVRVGKLNARAAGAIWTGWLEVPRGCGLPENCPVRFALNTEETALGQLSEWANPKPKKRAWYQVLGESPKPSLFARVRASGSVAAERFRIHTLTATHMSANLRLDSGKLQISALKAYSLGGKYQGKWQADFSVKPPVCRGSGDFTGLSLANVAAAMKDAWIAGTANASYELKGPCSTEFWQSAEGTVQAEMRDGALPHLLIGEDAVPLRVSQLTGHARMHGGELEIEDGKLSSSDGNYEVSGTATLQREIALKFTRIPSAMAATGYAISGTLAEPQVTPLARAEQARLKSLPTK